MFNKFLLAGTSACALALGATPLFAQSATTADPAATEEAGGLGDIVVTAQRRAQSLQTVPLSVTAVTGETLTSRGVTDVSQLAKFVPGFNFGRSGSDARPAMRGIRTANNEVTGDPVIGYFVDGIYQSRTSQATLGFVDVAQVEVQRGPQGTLFGRNTIGGNITVTTNEPGDSFDYGGTLTGANYSRVRLEGFVNTPLTPTLSFRLAGAFENQGGYVKDDFIKHADLFDERQRFIRGSLRFEPSAEFKAVLRVARAFNGGHGGSAFGYKQIGTYVDPATCQTLFNTSVALINSRAGNRDGIADCTTTVAGPAGAAGTGVDIGIPIYKAGDKYAVDNDYKTRRSQKQTQASLDMQYDFGPVTLKSLTGFVDYNAVRTSDSDFSSSTIAIDSQLTTARTYSQELQLLSSSKSSKLQYVAGVFYYHDDLGSLFINQQLPRTIRSSALATPITAAANNGTYNYNKTKLESKAVYAQATYHLTDQLSFTGGVRYTNDHKQFFNASGNGFLPLPVAGQPSPLTLINFGLPTPPNSFYGARPTNCGTAGVTAGFNIDSAGRFVGANYCPATFKQTTYRAGVDYQLTDTSLLYGTVSSGFRSGGFNSGQVAAQAAPTFQPETVTAFEIGSKNRFFDRTVQVNVAAFLNNYKDLQEQRQVIIGGTTLQTTFNAATARSYGVEFETLWQPTPEVHLGANLSLLSAKYRDFNNVPLPYGTSILVPDATQTAPTVVNGVVIAAAGQRRIFAPGYTCTPTAGTGGVGQPALAFGCDLSGNRIPHSPKFSGSAFASYDFDLGNLGTLTPFAAVTFSGKYDEQAFNDKLGRSPGYAKIDLNLTWAYNPQLTFEAFATNVNNATVRTIVSYGGTPLQASYEPPRQFGVRVTVRK
ncbi:TonB-dependent receptor [Glacieibacterium sp.]|uniref:TonB-dependent receptor n=1 Tax=Glacieibacterium sp. TaxID=2860237 RepID=UPI003AFF71DA